jgi:hypothetical protein
MSSPHTCNNHTPNTRHVQSRVTCRELCEARQVGVAEAQLRQQPVLRHQLQLNPIGSRLELVCFFGLLLQELDAVAAHDITMNATMLRRGVNAVR